MTDPSAAIQAAVNAALRGRASLAQLLGGAKVYASGQVPQGSALPYVTIGEDDILDDTYGDLDGSETHCKADVWAPQMSQARLIMAEVLAALDAEIAITGHRVVSHFVERVRHLPQSATVAAHSFVTIRYLTAPTG